MMPRLIRRPAPSRHALRAALPLYAFAAALSGAALLITDAIGSLEADSPFLLPLAAVMLCSWAGGLGPGLLGAAISVVGSNYLFLQPTGSLRVEDADLLRVSLFALVVLLVSLLNASRKRAMEERAASERQLRLIADAVPSRIAYVDRDQRYRFNNRAYEVAFGRSRAEIVGRRLDEIVHPSHYEEVQPRVAAALAGQGVTFERTLPGDRRVEVTYVPDIAADGAVRGFVAVVHDVTDRVRANERERDRANRAALLAEASRDLTAAGLDDEEIARAIGRRLAESLGDACVVRLVSPDGPWLTPVAVFHALPEAADDLRRLLDEAPQRIDEGLNGRVIATGEAAYLPRIAPNRVCDVVKPEHRSYAERWGLASVIVAPMRAHDRVLGTVTAIRGEARPPYDADDLALLQDLADRAALAIDNARLYAAVEAELAERRRAEQRIARLQAAAAALAAARTAGEVAEAILAEGLAALGATAGAVCLLTETGDQLELLRSRGYPRPPEAAWRHVPVDASTLAGDAVAQGRALVIETWAERVAGYPRQEELATADTRGAAAALPLLHEGRPLGAISLAFPTDRRFEPADRAFMDALASLCAQALERARLYDAERSLRAAAQAAEARYRGLFEATPEGVIVTDAEGRYLEVNPAACALLGYARDELIGIRMGDLVPPHDPPAGAFVQFGATAAWRGETELRRKDGTIAPVEATIRRVELPGGAIHVGAIRDISGRREIERLRRDLISSLSHDLKNPLGAIKGQSQLLARQLRRGNVDPDRLQEGLARIEATTSRMTALLEELSDVAQLQAGEPVELRRGPVDLVTLAGHIVDLYQKTTERHTITIETAEPQLVGHWDGPRLERVLANLLINAIKFSPEGGPVVVRVATETDDQGHRALLSVADRGVGIPAADLPHVFDRFRRGANVADRIGGTGLGLSGARQIVAQHGGAITLASEEGRGTTVTLRLPLAPD